MSHGSGGPQQSALAVDPSGRRASQAADFVAALKASGFDFFVGVPCSLLKGLVSILDHDEAAHYVSATREDSAIGMAVGAYLGGKTPMVLMQNSGLGVSVNALASLSTMYDLPALLVISWRGEPSLNDAPEHILMGQIMLPILDLLKVPYRVLSPKEPVAPQVAWAKDKLSATKRPVALVAPAGVLE